MVGGTLQAQNLLCWQLLSNLILFIVAHSCLRQKWEMSSCFSASVVVTCIHDCFDLIWMLFRLPWLLCWFSASCQHKYIPFYYVSAEKKDINHKLPSTMQYRLEFKTWNNSLFISWDKFFKLFLHNAYGTMSPIN